MLLLLALFGCNPGSNDVDGPGDGPRSPDVTHAAAALPQIATRPPAHPAAARIAPPAPPLPTGQAVYTDCGAGPWPVRSRGNNGIASRGTAPPHRP